MTTTTTDAPPFRGLSAPFLDALDILANAPEGAWWRDVLAHPDLILAVRRESLNVYYRGASLFRVGFRQGGLVPETHVKYLVRQQQTLATLDKAGSFVLDPGAVLWNAYAGPQTLAEMMGAAATLVGPEKAGLHPLIQVSSNVIDVEIALAGEPEGGTAANSDAADESELATSEPASSAPSAKPPQARQDRIDVASLETRGHPSEAWLVFHEAKHFSNPALRAAPKKRPPVLGQLDRYQGSLHKNWSSLTSSYPRVCRALLRLDALRRRVRADHPAWIGQPQPALDPVIRQVAEGTRKLNLEFTPRLVVFGFDADQRDGAWAALRQRLEHEHGATIYAVGKPQGVKATPAFRTPQKVLDVTAAELAKVAAMKNAPPPPSHIAMPANAPAAVVLLFVHEAGRSTLPVYLCNVGPAPLTDVAVTGGSIAAAPLSPTWTDKLDEHEATVPAGTGTLIGEHRPLWDGDDLVFYSVQFTDQDGKRHRVEAGLNKVPHPPQWVKLSPVKPRGAS